MDKLKLECMFRLLHEENMCIMNTLLAMACYPKDYEETKEKIQKDWDTAFQKIMRIDNEEKRYNQDDNNRATGSNQE